MMTLPLPSVHFGVAQTFVRLSLNRASHIITKGIADVRDYMFAEIFSRPRLGSSVCVAWLRLLFSDVGASCSHPLDPKEHNFLRLKCEAISEAEWRYHIIIAYDHPKHHDVDRMFDFNQYEYESVLRLIPNHSEVFVLALPVRIFLRSELHHRAPFLPDRDQLTLVWCTVEKTEKEKKLLHKINN